MIYGPSHFDELFQMRHGEKTIPQPHSQTSSLVGIPIFQVEGRFPTSVTGQEGMSRMTDASVYVTLPGALVAFRYYSNCRLSY